MADPAKTLELLWRTAEPARRRGPQPGLTLDEVVDVATELADREGLEGLSMRALAKRLDVTPMALYTYVPGKDELLGVMLDRLYLRMPRPSWADEDWRERVAAVAAANRQLYAAHPWAAELSASRPPLGPGLMAKYEHELAALDGTGLGDIEIDAALTFVLGFVRAVATEAAAAEAAGRDSGRTDEEWWAEHAPLLQHVLDAEAYPLATRVGTAAGAAQGGAYSAERAWAFGLERVLDGLAALIAGR